MKTVLNIVTTLLIILFLGYQFYIESCENKCNINLTLVKKNVLRRRNNFSYDFKIKILTKFS